MIRKSPDDSDRNYDIVHMIKKIALAIEKKNTQDLRNIAEELESWEPRENWDDMDVRTKVFVEHLLVGLARIQLGLDVLDKGANELTEIRQEVEEKEMNDAVVDSLDEDDYSNPKNADIIQVVDRRRGLPVALGIIYLHLAREMEWDAYGLNFPGHFLFGLVGIVKKMITFGMLTLVVVQTGPGLEIA